MTNARIGSAEEAAGQRLHQLVAELFPICRSITGEGLRATLRRIQREIPITIHEVPSGTPAFDWTVPREWNIRDAYIENSRGERVVDFSRSNLHVVHYSVPVQARMSLDELRPHLHSLPDRPDWIPYRTSYYKETWGFCLSHQDLLQLADGEYEVRIDSTLHDGHLSYGELLVEGETSDEVLLSCHACHPSLANDNLSGIAIAVALARDLLDASPRYSYRFLFIPGTIGSITWLALNRDRADRIKHGLVLSCLGDPGGFTYKRSRRGDALIDRAVPHVLRHWGRDHRVRAFTPYGYDERQYCSPGFNLPVGCLMRTPNGEYPEYHTSADDLDLVTADALSESYRCCLSVLDVIENDRRYINLNPHCEPQLGKRGLYRTTGGDELPGFELGLLWVLNLTDGDHSLLDIAERAGMPFGVISEAANALESHELVKRVD